MTARQVQHLIGAIFLALGSWCLISPQSVIHLAIRPEFQSTDYLTGFAVACLGAQACQFALVCFAANFTRRTFLAFGSALLPFLAFNHYFYFEIRLLSEVGLIDFAGNSIMLALCWYGWSIAQA